jgi:hypothetical protein
MIIRDNGSTVTFLLTNTYSGTYTYGKSWSGTVNNTSVGGSYDLVGATTVTLGSWTVSSTQTVTFAIGSTGTSGLGGPSSFSVTISRAAPPPTVKVPAAPSEPTVSAITQTSAKIAFSDGANNGGAINKRQISYGTTSAASTTVVTGNSGTTISNLAPFTNYWVKARTHNSAGWGPWSAAREFTTVAGAWVNDNGTWKQAVPYVNVNGTWKVAQPYVNDGGTWKATT